MEPCTHESTITICDGTTDTVICRVCGKEASEPCPEAGSWPYDPVLDDPRDEEIS